MCFNSFYEKNLNKFLTNGLETHVITNPMGTPDPFWQTKDVIYLTTKEKNRIRRFCKNHGAIYCEFGIVPYAIKLPFTMIRFKPRSANNEFEYLISLTDNYVFTNIKGLSDNSIKMINDTNTIIKYLKGFKRDYEKVT